MIFQESFRFFGYYDAVEMGLYFVIVGYDFLLFAYFLFMRWRTSKKSYWFFLSVLFLCLAAARVFFIVYYFFIPELENIIINSEVVSLLMFYYRLATFFTWLAISCLMGILGLLLFPPNVQVQQGSSSNKKPIKLMEILKKNRKQVNYVFRIALTTFPIVIGILALSLPDNVFMDPDLPSKYHYPINLIVVIFGTWEYPIGRFVLNFVLLPLMVPIIPILFLYLAWKTFGVLRKSYALMSIGYCIYFAGRIAQGVFEALGHPHLRAVIPPLLILLSLLLIVIANNYEQLK